MTFARRGRLIHVEATEFNVLVLTAPVTRDDVPLLCGRLRALHRAGAAEVICDVGALTRPDLIVVEALARLRLTARRSGCRIVVRHPGPELRALLELVGLQLLGEPEQGEPPRRVQEAVESGDTAL